MDGTLVDSRPAIEKAAQHAIAIVLPQFLGRTVTTCIGPPIREMFRRTLDNPSADVLDRLVAVFRSAYDSVAWRETPAYPGVVELLAEIQANRAVSFVVTNKPFRPSTAILQTIGCSAFVREIVTPDSPLQAFRSKSEALHGLVSRHRLDAEDILVVGDSVDDAEAAKVSGLSFAAALYGYGNLTKDDGYPVQEPSDLIKFIRRRSPAGGGEQEDRMEVIP